MSDRLDIRIRGKTVTVPAITVAGTSIISTRRYPRIGQMFDELWLERSTLPPIELVIAELKSKKQRPDIFTFAQRVPDSEPKYRYYYEFDNYAVLPLSTYDQWFRRQITGAVRTKVRAGEKRGVVVRVATYHDNFVEGISSVNNETPFRGGRRFWHFARDFDSTKEVFGTYADRSTYLAAYRGEEMVGYLKMVWDAGMAHILHLLSKTSARDCQPNNALLSEAVRQCCLQNASYLLYGRFDYGRKVEDSLQKFKRSNGFVRMDVPRYYVPLTRAGDLALRLGLHTKLADRVPEWIAAPLRNLRARWYTRHTA
jgi:hypothetical protein